MMMNTEEYIQSLPGINWTSERTIDKPGVIHFTIYFAKHT
jgi:hypothetical protein